MPDHSLKELVDIVGTNPQVPWSDFRCTPVLEFDAEGKATGTAGRCAITAGDVTTVIKLPHRMAIEKQQSWPPQAVVDAMMEAVGPGTPT